MTAPSVPAPSDVGARHRVVSSVELWRRTRLIVIYMAVVFLVVEGITVYGHHQFDPSYLVVSVVLLLMAAAIYLRQRTHYVEMGGDGLILRSSFKRMAIPYESLRQSRCQTLRQYFDAPSRRELLKGSLSRFAGLQACIVRVDLDPAELLQVGRLVGRRTVLEQDLILVVQNAAALDRGLQLRIRKRPPAPAARAARRK